MSVVNITGKKVLAEDFSLLQGGFIDLPEVSSAFDIFVFKISGWVLGKEKKAILVDILHDGITIRKIPINSSRPDVHEAYRTSFFSDECGFDSAISIIGLPKIFRIDLIIVFENGEKETLGYIEGKRESLQTNYEPKIHPIILCAIGRSGTTRTMQLLSEHPQIIAEKIFPYEHHCALYWMHAFKVLSGPANHFSSANIDHGDMDWNSVGHNPFFSFASIDNPVKLNWLGYTHINQLAGFFQKTIDEYYMCLSGENKNNIKCFLEKWHIGFSDPFILQNLYKEEKIFIQVRDFRDILCSHKSFIKDYINNNHYVCEEDAIEVLAKEIKKAGLKLLNLANKTDRKIYIQKYEEVVLNPYNSLVKLLDYLGLSSDSSTINKILDYTSTLTQASKNHITSKNANASIGRWKTDSDHFMEYLYHKYFNDLLNEFGYES